MCLGCGVEHTACKDKGGRSGIEVKDSDGFADCSAAIGQIGIVAHGQPFRLTDGGHGHTDGNSLTGRQCHIDREKWRVVLAGHAGDITGRGTGGELPIELARTTHCGQCAKRSIGVGQVVQFGS